MVTEPDISRGSKDPMGDRMKMLEAEFSELKIASDEWFALRLDGRSFSTLSKRLKIEKPFSSAMKVWMDHVAMDLLLDLRPDLVYNQSDEITLLFKPRIDENERFEHVFGGKVQKLVSVSASIAGSSFRHSSDEVGIFDSRAIRLGKNADWKAWNLILWRQRDSIRNSLQGIAQSRYSQSELNGKSLSDLKEMVPDWNNFEDKYLYGTFHIFDKEHRTIVEHVTSMDIHKLRINDDVPEFLSNILDLT